MSFDKWLGGNNSQTSTTGIATMQSHTEVTSPADSPTGRLSRWFSIRRGSSHNYDVGGKDSRSGSLEKEIKSPGLQMDRTSTSGSKMPQLSEVCTIQCAEILINQIVHFFRLRKTQPLMGLKT